MLHMTMTLNLKSSILKVGLGHFDLQILQILCVFFTPILSLSYHDLLSDVVFDL